MLSHLSSARDANPGRYGAALIAFTSAALLSANGSLPDSPTCGGVRISEPDLRKLIVGRTISIVAADGSQKFSQTFFPNGKMKSERSPFGLGEYRISGDQICTATDGKSWYCTPIIKTKRGYFSLGQATQGKYCLKISIK